LDHDGKYFCGGLVRGTQRKMIGTVGLIPVWALQYVSCTYAI
jgi:hypothetical protein